jgi:hypothetical protein
LTGKKQNSTPLPNAGVNAAITSAQHEVLAACNDIVTAVAFVQSQALSASGQCEKIAPALKILREAIAEFPQEFRFSS